MKKLLLLPALMLLFASCDFMLKERDDTDAETGAEKKVVLGHDKDEKGCVASAGYRWSVLRKECIRVFEEGYRLNSADSLKAEDINASAFIVFDNDEKNAELYLPEEQRSVVLEKESEGIYKEGNWSLNTKVNYQVSNSGRLLYAAAAIQENKVIGDDWKGEGEGAPQQVTDTVNR